MIFQYETKEINGNIYITGSRLLAERGQPGKSYEFGSAFNRKITDQNGQFQWTIRENPDYDPKTDHIDDRYIIEHNPILPTPEELEAERQAAIKRLLVAELPDIIFQNKDNPAVLAQALCDRAKQIEVEITVQSSRN